jgi:hypothetical protein
VARAWNIFSISREPRNEDQLTEMLAWLANAVPAVRRALLKLAFAESLDEREVEITTQHGIAKGRLDAFLSSESVALVVERQTRQRLRRRSTGQVPHLAGHGVR